MDTAYSKNSLTTNVFYHKMKSRDSFTKELARQKTKIDNSFKATPNQNQNKKPTLESDSSINTISKSGAGVGKSVRNEILQYVKINLKYMVKSYSNLPCSNYIYRSLSWQWFNITFNFSFTDKRKQ